MDGEVWKIVWEDRLGRLYSLYQRVFTSYCLQYEKGEITRPTVGELFAYATAGDAEIIDRSCGRIQIWRARATGIEEAPEWLPTHRSEFKIFWEGGFPRPTIPRWTPPPGTVLCNSIELLERIA